MSTKSGILWTDSTWSPVTGCAKVSAGCKNCYAEREVESRWSKNPKSVFYGRAFTDVRCHPDTLEQPLHWKKPRKIFVCPRGDLFHPDVPSDFIDHVFAVMALCPQHTFQVLTKRPERMLEYMTDDVTGRIAEAAPSTGGYIERWSEHGEQLADCKVWPLPNVWIGVSVEDQATADERIPQLMETPAVVHWISVEPMLGAVSCTVPFDGGRVDMLHRDFPGHPRIDWVVVGGESGAKARPMHPEWVRSLRDQCVAADVPFLFKQWGEYLPGVDATNDQTYAARSGGWVRLDGGFHDGNDQTAFLKGDAHVLHVGTKAAGNLLDGQEWNQYPEATA